MFERKFAGAQTQQVRKREREGERREVTEGGSERNQQQQKKTQFIAEMYLIFIYTQHSTAD